MRRQRPGRLAQRRGGRRSAPGARVPRRKPPLPAATPVLAEIQDAVARSVGHPDHRPVHGWVQAEACFAFVLWHAGDYAGAAERMAALGDRVTDSYPWFDKDEFASVRRILRGMGGAR
ncbi:hypothetical protein ACFQZ4_06830 [Catellatospora coxensis]